MAKTNWLQYIAIGLSLTQLYGCGAPAFNPSCYTEMPIASLTKQTEKLRVCGRVMSYSCVNRDNSVVLGLVLSSNDKTVYASKTISAYYFKQNKLDEFCLDLERQNSVVELYGDYDGVDLTIDAICRNPDIGMVIRDE